MGNKASSLPTPDPAVLNDDYEWPENMYLELRDMANISFLVYTFAYLTDVAREFGLKGMVINDEGRIGMPTRDLPRSFSPAEVIEIIENNLDTLKSRYQTFFDGSSYELLIQKLKLLQEREESSGLHRPLTLEEYDDRHQKHDLVYGITKDDVNKRLSLVFRGTENELAFRSNWLSNAAFLKKEYELPSVLQDNDVVESLRLHSGFGKYVFDFTFDEDDPVTWRKYDEILEDVKLLLQEYPDYKLYVTGHSLGAALSTIVGFYLACDPDIPKPVTIVNFASPRVGGRHFLYAARWLERKRWLRVLRVVNNGDTIAAMPMTNYHHIGIQLRLFKDIGKEPRFTYPSAEETYRKYVGRLWENSVGKSFNLRYDHGDYRERVDKDKLFLIKYDMNSLYDDNELTGFNTEDTQVVQRRV
ncbi:MAG: hypothetical protein SGBAC_001199 [Bacillariaceae sp.]